MDTVSELATAPPPARLVTAHLHQCVRMYWLMKCILCVNALNVRITRSFISISLSTNRNFVDYIFIFGWEKMMKTKITKLYINFTILTHIITGMKLWLSQEKQNASRYWLNVLAWHVLNNNFNYLTFNINCKRNEYNTSLCNPYTIRIIYTKA